MNRWVYRIAGLLMLLLFALVFTQLHKQLRALQQQQQPAATSTTR